MKTKVEYESTDIDMADPRHSTIAVSILLAQLAMADEKGKMVVVDRMTKEQADRILTSAVPSFLTTLETTGYVIIKREEAPAVSGKTQ